MTKLSAPSHWKQRVKTRFDAQAHHYGAHNDLQERIAKSLANDLPRDLPQNAHILEIGCGTGALTQHLFTLYPDAVFEITDISPNMIEVAKASVTPPHGAKFNVMDGEAPDMDKRYDLIISNMALQWFETPRESLARLTALLKPNGMLFFSVPSQNSFPEWRETLRNQGLSSGFDTGYDWPHIYKKEEITIDYGSTLDFLKHLKTIGASTPQKGYIRLTTEQIKHACMTNDKSNNGNATWHIYFGSLSRNIKGIK